MSRRQRKPPYVRSLSLTLPDGTETTVELPKAGKVGDELAVIVRMRYARGLIRFVMTEAGWRINI